MARDPPPTSLLSPPAAAPPDLAAAVRAAHRFLHLRSCINIGVLKGEPPPPGSEAAVAAAAAAAAAPRAPGTPPTPAELAAALADALAAADMATTTEKGLRLGLEDRFGCSLADRKNAIRSQVTAFLAGDASWAPEEGDTPPAPYCRPGASAVVVGAGPAGAAAASHLARCGVRVTLIDARPRAGGRVHTVTGALACPADTGASIVTGTAADGGAGGARARRADPSALLARQLGVPLHTLAPELPLFDAATGAPVPADVDARAAAMVDALLDDAADRVAELSAADADAASLGAELEAALAARLAAAARAREAAAEVASAASAAPPADAPPPADPAEPPTAPLASDNGNDSDAEAARAAAAEAAAFAAAGPAERRAVGWHLANLEYGCAAPLTSLSLPHWNQDEAGGGFGGPHAMVVGGYGALLERWVASLAGLGVDVRLGEAVVSVAAVDGEGATVTLAGGGTVKADVAIVAVPLGVLKARAIAFDPPLPPYKEAAIDALGFGALNKAFLQFPARFWPDTDYFGVALDPSPATRGAGFMFWDVGRFAPGAPPVLAALVAGEAAAAADAGPPGAAAAAALASLRAAFPHAAVPDPVATLETRWGADAEARGAYSFVAPGASGATYDALALPASPHLLFAGEHTCRAHPDTVGGAVLTGWRESARALGGALASAADALAAARGDATAAGSDDDSDAASLSDDADAFPGGRRRGADREARPRAAARAPARAAAPPRPQTGAEAAAEAARADREREAARSLWRALAGAAGGDAAPLDAALSAADAAPPARAAALAVLACASERELVALARPATVRLLASWVEAAAGDRGGGAAAADGARLLGALPLPARDRAPTGAERAVRRVADAAVDKGARGAGGAVLDRWYGAREAPACAPAAKARSAAAAVAITDDDLDEGVRARLVAAEAAAAAAAARAAEVAASAAAAPSSAAPAKLADFAAFSARASKDADKAKALAKRKVRAAAALAEADDAAPGPATTAPPSGGLKAAVRDAVSAVLKPLFKKRKLDRAGYDAAGRKAAEKILATAPADTPLPLSDGRKRKMGELALSVARAVRSKRG